MWYVLAVIFGALVGYGAARLVDKLTAGCSHNWQFIDFKDALKAVGASSYHASYGCYNFELGYFLSPSALKAKSDLVCPACGKTQLNGQRIRDAQALVKDLDRC